MLLDTDFIIDLMAGHEGAVEALNKLEATSEPQFISSVTLFELHHSIARVNHPEKRRKKIETVLDDRPVLDADSQVMKAAGQAHGHLVADGSEVGPLDVIIATTALTHGESVLPGNEKDFSRIFLILETSSATEPVSYEK